MFVILDTIWLGYSQRVFSATTRIENKRAAIISHGGLAYVDFLFVWISFFSLSSYMILRLLRFTHYNLVYLFLDIPYDHIVITLSDEAYLFLHTCRLFIV